MNNTLNIKSSIDTPNNKYRKILINDYSLDTEDTIYFNCIFSINKDINCKSKIVFNFCTFTGSEEEFNTVSKISIDEYIILEAGGKKIFSLCNNLLNGNYIMEINLKKNLFSFKLINPDSSVHTYMEIKDIVVFNEKELNMFLDIDTIYKSGNNEIILKNLLDRKSVV